MCLICSHMDSKLPQSAISALIWASWMKCRSVGVCAHVCVWAKARKISQFLSTNLCKEHYFSPAVQRLEIKIWSSSTSPSTVWTSSPDQLTSRFWVSVRRSLVWLLSLSKSVWFRRWWTGKADDNKCSWANSSERSSDEEESPSTVEESKSLMHSYKQQSYVCPGADDTPIPGLCFHMSKNQINTLSQRMLLSSLGEKEITHCITL